MLVPKAGDVQRKLQLEACLHKALTETLAPISLVHRARRCNLRLVQQSLPPSQHAQAVWLLMLTVSGAPHALLVQELSHPRQDLPAPGVPPHRKP